VDEVLSINATTLENNGYGTRSRGQAAKNFAPGPHRAPRGTGCCNGDDRRCPCPAPAEADRLARARQEGGLDRRRYQVRRSAV